MTPSCLKATRVDLGMTQAQLATELGLSRVMIGLMERGEKPIEARTEMAVKYLTLTAAPQPN